MEKLELKYVAAYLPYSLRWKVKNKIFYTGYFSNKAIALVDPHGCDGEYQNLLNLS
jgi:hypothetical protein